MPLVAADSAASDDSPEAGDLPSLKTASVNDGESKPTADDFPTLAATKTRGLKRRCREASTQDRGVGRLKTFRVHENGTRVSQNQDGSTAVGGIGRAVAQANRSGCECLLRLQDAEKQLGPALKTNKEMELSKKKSQGYNFARLTRILSYLMFDERGNWLVHSKCLRSFLSCSTNYPAHLHRVNLGLRDAPIERMAVERARALNISRYAVIPEGCVLSVNELLLEPQSKVVDINRSLLPSAHGSSASLPIGQKQLLRRRRSL
jgi:hypothetical protein